MANLDHPNIVRLFGEDLWYPRSTGGSHNHLSVSLSPPAGICVRNPIMLVMEIASLGPLNKFLRRHPSVPINLVLYDVIVMSYEWYTFLRVGRAWVS